MHYKKYLFTRGRKEFHPYNKRILHSGGSIATDRQLIRMLGNMKIKHKPKHHCGGTIKNKLLLFSR